MASSRARPHTIALAASLILLTVVATACGASRETPDSKSAPEVSASTADGDPEVEVLFAELNVADWADGAHGMNLEMTDVPGGLSAADAQIVRTDLSRWMRRAVLEPTVWYAADSAQGLAAFLPGVPDLIRPTVSEQWPSEDLLPAVFATMFPAGAEVVGEPKVDSALASYVTDDGNVEFAMTTAAAYAVTHQDRVSIIPIVRQVRLATPPDGAWARAGDYGWNIDMRSYASCDSTTQGVFIPDAEPEADSTQRIAEFLTMPEQARQSATVGKPFDLPPATGDCS